MNTCREIVGVKSVARRLSRTGRVLSLALLASITASVSACDISFFDVDNPTNIVSEELNDPALVEALGNTPETAVTRSLANAYVWAAVTSDEGFLAGSGTFRIQLDLGIFSPDNQLTGEEVYDPLAASRWIADEALRRLTELLDNPNSSRAVANAHYWGGVARITLADHFEVVVYDGQAPITPRKAIQDAREKFQMAAQVAQAAGDANLTAAAYGSVARAYRSLYFEELHYGAGENPALFQQAAEAAQTALNLRPDFIEYANYAPPGSSNFLYSSFVTDAYTRMDPILANLRDPVSGELDPRIKHGPNTGPSVRTGEPVFLQQKFDGPGADVPISRAAEARLIISEYELEFGDPQRAVALINEVRAAVGLPAFSSTDEAEIREQLRYERKVEFWLEGRRWQDMRYYEILPPRWTTTDVHLRWPVSVAERNNNPNL